MTEKRYTMKYSFDDEEYVFFDGDVALTPSETAKLLNEQQATIEQLRTQLTICQQSKNDDGRFQVWEIPPIPIGKRISFTTSNGDKDE